MAGRGKANAIDARVGHRLKLRRIALGLSQVDVGALLDLTFQQVQKFEKGTNRITPAYLRALCIALHVSPSYFFEQDDDRDDYFDFREDAAMKAMNNGHEGYDLWQGYMRLRPALRPLIRALVVAIARAKP